MKLASLKGPTRDGTLVVVNRDLTRAVKAGAIAVFSFSEKAAWLAAMSRKGMALPPREEAIAVRIVPRSWPSISFAV